MGAVRFAGIVFIARPLDHVPPHVHAITSSGEVVIELLGNGWVPYGLTYAKTLCVVPRPAMFGKL